MAVKTVAKNAQPKEIDWDHVQAVLVCGTDEYEMRTKTRQVVQRLCPPENQSFGLEVMDGAVRVVSEAVEVIRKTVDALESLGFLGGGKTIWMKDCSFLGQDVLGRSVEVKEWMTKLNDLLKSGLPPGQRLVINAEKIFRNSPLYKWMKKDGVIFEFDVPDSDYRRERPALQKAGELMKEAGLRPKNAKIMAMFVQRSGFETRQMVQEVEKLSLYLGENGIVDEDAIDLMVSPSKESALWDIVDAVTSRDLTRVQLLLKQLFFQKSSPVAMLIMLENQFNKLISVSSCVQRRWLRFEQGRGDFVSAKWELNPEAEACLDQMGEADPRKINHFILGRMSTACSQFHLRELVWCRERLLRTHRRMFLTGGIPHEDQLEDCLVEIIGRTHYMKVK